MGHIPKLRVEGNQPGSGTKCLPANARALVPGVLQSLSRRGWGCQQVANLLSAGAVRFESQVVLEQQTRFLSFPVLPQEDRKGKRLCAS